MCVAVGAFEMGWAGAAGGVAAVDGMAGVGGRWVGGGWAGGGG